MLRESRDDVCVHVLLRKPLLLHTIAYVSVRQRTSAYVSKRPRVYVSAYVGIDARVHALLRKPLLHTSACVSIRQHRCACVYMRCLGNHSCIRQRTSAYVSIDARVHVLLIGNSSSCDTSKARDNITITHIHTHNTHTQYTHTHAHLANGGCELRSHNNHPEAHAQTQRYEEVGKRLPLPHLTQHTSACTAPADSAHVSRGTGPCRMPRVLASPLSVHTHTHTHTTGGSLP